MVCKLCVELTLDNYKKVDENRSGLIGAGIKRVRCNCGYIYEKITDEKKITFEDRIVHGIIKR